MPMPVSLMQSVPGFSSDIVTAPSFVYFNALERICSTTNESHFSSEMTVMSDAAYSSRSFFMIKSPRNFRTLSRSTLSRLTVRKT